MDLLSKIGEHPPQQPVASVFGLYNKRWQEEAILACGQAHGDDTVNPTSQSLSSLIGPVLNGSNELFAGRLRGPPRGRFLQELAIRCDLAQEELGLVNGPEGPRGDDSSERPGGSHLVEVERVENPVTTTGRLQGRFSGGRAGVGQPSGVLRRRNG